MKMEEEEEEREYDSGPYCRHWGSPGDCDECDTENKAIREAIALLKTVKPFGAIEDVIRKLEQIDGV